MERIPSPRSVGSQRVRQVLGVTLAFSLAMSGSAFANDDLTEMSLEELMGIEVTSVAKKAQSKTTAAAAITVITAEDIRRGGFTLIPEALRTVPGLQVARVDGNSWAISVRGFNSRFANKLLVLIDGRSVYTPAFGGTYWDAQDYPIEDVERIEVIRGPGATIWGANAVNGVINIITKHAENTQGVLLSGYGGSIDSGLTARYGGSAGEDTHYRAYVRGFRSEDFDVTDRYDGSDEWTQGRAGIRIDTQLSESDTLRVSGDFYAQDSEQNAFNPTFATPFRHVHYETHGGNVLVNWDRKLTEKSSLQAKAYYIGDKRDFLLNEERHTADLELQHNFTVLDDDALPSLDQVAVTWGGNYRFSTSRIDNESVGTGVMFSPNDAQSHIASGFVQAQADFFDEHLSVIFGTKLGYNNWSNFEYQPSGRVIFKPTNGHAIWAAVSRAVRTPTQAERDVMLPIPGMLPVVGNRDTRSEDLLAFELGYRFFALERVNAEVSLFWNEYEDVSSFHVVLNPGPVAVAFVNRSEFTTRGGEVEVNILPMDWWRLRLTYSYLHIDEDPSSSPLTASFGKAKFDNPPHQFSVQNFFELPMGFEFDASLYWVDGLPGTLPTGITQNVESYVRLDLRIGYKPCDWAEIALVGQNLTKGRHYEANDFTFGQSTQVPRSGYAKVTLNF